MKNKSKLVQATQMARKNVRNLAVYLLPESKCEIINMNTLEQDQPNYNNYKSQIEGLTRDEAMTKLREIDRAHAVSTMCDMTKFKHSWSVLLFICGRCPLTGSYWKTSDVAPPGKFYSSQINASLQVHHDQMINDFNPNHFVSLGWIARPVDELYDNDLMYDLFMRLGAWDYLAKWES